MQYRSRYQPLELTDNMKPLDFPEVVISTGCWILGSFPSVELLAALLQL